MTKRHRTVDRVTTILEYAVSSPSGVTLRELADLLGAPKSSVHSLVQGLVAAAYLSEENGRLHGGPGVRALTGHLRVPWLVRASTQLLEELTEVSDETAMLGTRVGNGIVYQAQAASPRGVRYVPQLLESRPLFTTALGKLYLAELDAEQLEELYETEQPDLSGGLSELRKALEQVRNEGVAYNLGDTVQELYAVSVPIRDEDKLLIAGVTVAGPQERMARKLSEVTDSAQKCAQRFSDELHLGRHVK